jgi:hypothetical protein
MSRRKFFLVSQSLPLKWSVGMRLPCEKRSGTGKRFEPVGGPALFFRFGAQIIHGA